MVCRAAEGQRIHRSLEVGNVGYELCVLRSRGGKADNSDAATRADLTVLRAVGSFINNVDKGFCAVF